MYSLQLSFDNLSLYISLDQAKEASLHMLSYCDHRCRPSSERFRRVHNDIRTLTITNKQNKHNAL